MGEPFHDALPKKCHFRLGSGRSSDDRRKGMGFGGGGKFRHTGQLKPPRTIRRGVLSSCFWGDELVFHDNYFLEPGGSSLSRTSRCLDGVVSSTDRGERRGEMSSFV